MAGASSCSKIRFTGRQQWVDTDKAPNLQTISFNGRLGESRSALGAIAYNDKNGYHSQSVLYLTYYHHILFSSIELDLDSEALQFLDFVVDQVSQTQLFKQLESDLQLNTE